MYEYDSSSRFIQAIRDNQLLNCPITVDDIQRADFIYGQDVAFLKGKKTASPAKDHLPDYKAIPLPSELLSLHNNVTLCFDIFYILDLTFSISTSRNLHFLSCRHLPDRSKQNILNCINNDLKLYDNRGFVPTEIHPDGEYNPVKESFPGVHFSITSADDHIPEAELSIRSVKETVRATIHGMPYKRLPRVMVKALVAFATRAINSFPHADGVSPTLSPDTIITGRPKPDYRDMKLEFGTYVEVYDGTSSDTKSRTLGAIVLNPAGPGAYFFLSLATGAQIHRRSWVVLPVSDATISSVEALALKQGMPLVDTRHMISEYDPDDLVDESYYDKDYVPPPTVDPDSDHHLTTDAYTDTDESSHDDSDDDDDHDDEGHHSDYDDEQFHPTLLTVETVDADDAGAPDVPTPPASNPITMFPATPTTQDEERTPELLQDEERTTAPPQEEERTPVPDSEPDRRPGLRQRTKPTYTYRFGFTQTAKTATSTEPLEPSRPSLILWNHVSVP
jgi:hypothetical protein